MPSPNFKEKTLFTRDNLYILRGMNSECVDLIYLDPPFNSKKNYIAPLPIKGEEILASFKDVWQLVDIDDALHEELQETQPCLYEIIKGTKEAHSKGMFSYLVYMTMRLVEMYRVLKPTGSIYLHCDPTASHYLKIVMDCIFGKSNFRNEVVWSYRTGGTSKRYFSKKHDIILFYSKEDAYIFNQQKEKAYTKSKNRKPGEIDYGGGTAEFFEDDVGVYNFVGMRDVWDVSYINSQAKERTGYPTQKPLALLERVIEASSNKGDLVLDPFCGCATTLVAAEKLGRKWVGIDVSPFAKHFVHNRMEKDLGKDVPAIFLNDISGRSCLSQEELADWEHKKRLYKEQEEICNGCMNHYHRKDMTIDHIIPTAKGGQDTQDNKQLLCFHCNTVKGVGSMETLWDKLNKGSILEEHEVTTARDRFKMLMQDRGLTQGAD